MQSSDRLLPISLDAFRAAVECHAIVSITDAAGTIVYANQHFCEISGYSEQELIGQNDRVVKSPVHSKDFFRTLWETISAGKTWHGEMCNRNKNGGLYWVKSTIVPVLDQQGIPAHYVSIRTDITDQKLQAEHLLELASEQNELLRIAPVGIARLSGRTFRKVNPAFASILDYDSTELIGKSTRQIYLSDEQFETVGREAYEPLTRGEYFKGEISLRKKDGSAIWVIAGTCSLTPEDPTRDTLYIVQDISEHKRLQQKLALALEKSKAAERAKQHFIDSMTHQLYTPLNGILGTTQLLTMEDFDPETQTLIEGCESSARRLLHMVDMSLQFAALDGSGSQSASLETYKLHECLDALLYQLGSLAETSGVSILRTIDPALEGFEFAADQKKLRQLLMLILDNAIRYNQPNGKVTVTASVGTTAAGKAPEFVVADTGCGLTHDQLARLGEPFTRFNENENIPGTGLGMTIVYRLAGLLGAEIQVSSTVGQGTTVTVSMPAVMDNGPDC